MNSLRIKLTKASPLCNAAVFVLPVVLLVAAVACCQDSNPGQPHPAPAIAPPPGSGDAALSIPAYPQQVQVGTLLPPGSRWCPPVQPLRCGVRCDDCPPGSEATWRARRMIPWQIFAQGEYVGPARARHVPQYRVRVDDQLEFVYRITAAPSSKPYELEVNDSIRIDSLSAEELSQELLIQPDGTITARMLGQVPAAGRSVEELRADLNQRYEKLVRNPQISVTPLKFNNRLDQLIATVDARAGVGGQFKQVRVTPEGTVQLPAIGSIPVQGMTLAEIKRETEERYAQIVSGIEITPILNQRAPRYVFVVGEVRAPGRYTLEGPTTVMQAIALAGSWNVGAHLKHVVIFRRDECWRLMATKVDIHGALFGKTPCPADEIWLRDSDIVLLPKSPILAADDMIELVFTRGVYGVFPVFFNVNFAKLSTL